jgi:hypothetical protein
VRLCSQSIETRVLVETPRAAIRFGRLECTVSRRPAARSDAQRRFEPGLVKPFDRHGRGLVADDGHGHSAETTREQIAIRLEIQLDIASEEWDAGL